MKNFSWTLGLSVALGAAAGLAGCGGGGGDEHTPAVTEAVPDSASRNVDDYIGYLRALVASAADALEPVDVSAVTPPSADSAEPTAVD